MTVSGGEPLEQAEGLADLLARIRAETGLGILVYTGMDEAEISNLNDMGREGRILPSVPDWLHAADALLVGPYRETRYAGHTHKRLFLLTERYGPGDFTGDDVAEWVLDPQGDCIQTGSLACGPGKGGA